MAEAETSLLLHQHIQQLYVLLDDGDRRVLRQVGLTPTQFRLLEQLDPAQTDTRTITQLSQVLLCTRGNITRLVRRMAQQGLVSCGTDSRDQRLVKVSLTDEGSARLAEARTLYHHAIHQRFSGLDHADQQALRRLTETVTNLLITDLEHQPPLPPDVETDEIE